MTRFYDYSVVSYVGDPVRGERVNIGLIVVSGGLEGGRVMFDRSSLPRIAALWPDLNRALVRAQFNDFARLVGAPRQLLLEEWVQPSGTSASAQTLHSLSARAVNQFQVTKPRKYRAESVNDALSQLFRRFVHRPRRRLSLIEDSGRHMNRAGLRDMIAGIFSVWAAQRDGSRIEESAEIQGEHAPHRADIIAFHDERPEFVLFALSFQGRGAPYSMVVRDSLPTVTSDVRAVHPETTFFAVLPDDTSKPAAVETRSLLEHVAGLEVLRVSELRQRVLGSDSETILALPTPDRRKTRAS